jgi:hypothetical protein
MTNDWRMEPETLRRRVLADLLWMLQVEVENADGVLSPRLEYNHQPTLAEIAGDNVEAIERRIALAEKVAMTLTADDTLRQVRESLVIARNDLTGIVFHARHNAAHPALAEDVAAVVAAVERVRDDCAMTWQRLSARLEVPRGGDETPVDHAADAAKVLADGNYPAVAEIAAAVGLTLDEKMRRIAVVHPSASTWKALRWAALLGVTDGRIRQSETWKAWRAAEKRD